MLSLSLGNESVVHVSLSFEVCRLLLEIAKPWNWRLVNESRAPVQICQQRRGARHVTMRVTVTSKFDARSCSLENIESPACSLADFEEWKVHFTLFIFGLCCWQSFKPLFFLGEDWYPWQAPLRCSVPQPLHHPSCPFFPFFASTVYRNDSRWLSARWVSRRWLWRFKAPTSDKVLNMASHAIRVEQGQWVTGFKVQLKCYTVAECAAKTL